MSELACARDAYKSAHQLMMDCHKRKRDEREDLRGKNLAPTCHLTGLPPSSRLLAAQDDTHAKPPRLPQPPVVSRTIFDELQVGGFGAEWRTRTTPRLAQIVSMLKDLFVNVSKDSPSITCALIVDQDVWPRDNNGKEKVAALPTPLREPARWAAFVRELRSDFGLRDIVKALASRLFGLRLTFHNVALVPYELYFWALPWPVTVQSVARGATVPTMSFVPEILLA
tara:strand:- start:444 stop:1121 length:678 start_codon:yes stop_codon:yes gene_type:complete